MSVEGVYGPGKTSEHYDHLLEGQLPEATLPPDQLRAYLDGLNKYLADLEAMDVPQEYLDSVTEVIDQQVSLVVGQQVTTTDGPGQGEGEGEVLTTDGPRVKGKTVDKPEEVDTPVDGPVEAGNAPPGMPENLWALCVKAGEKTGIDPYILAAQMEKESQFGKALAGSPSAGDGLMQVEPTTRGAYAAKFKEVMGHDYNHASQEDQVAMAAVILADKGGSPTNMLLKYNGGDNWTPGCCDSYGRPILADQYAATVLARAREMKGN